MDDLGEEGSSDDSGKQARLLVQFWSPCIGVLMRAGSPTSLPTWQKMLQQGSSSYPSVLLPPSAHCCAAGQLTAL